MNAIEKIRKLMKFNNLNQKQLALNIGMSPITISRLLSGKRKLTIGYALKISNYFKVSLDWLLDEEN